MTYTAAGIIAASPKFVEIAATEALQFIAKNNGQSYEIAKKAFELGATNVTTQVLDLVKKSAQALADQLNSEAAV